MSTVWFVRILTVSSVNSDSDRALPAFPLGWSIRSRALYYDNMGRQFQSHNIQTLSQLTGNYTDTHVYVTHSSGLTLFFSASQRWPCTTDSWQRQSVVLVQTASPGTNCFEGAGRHYNPFLSDYTPLFVMPAIPEPTGFLHPGDVICFSSPITDLQGKSLGY